MDPNSLPRVLTRRYRLLKTLRPRGGEVRHLARERLSPSKTNGSAVVIRGVRTWTGAAVAQLEARFDSMKAAALAGWPELLESFAFPEKRLFFFVARRPEGQLLHRVASRPADLKAALALALGRLGALHAGGFSGAAPPANDILVSKDLGSIMLFSIWGPIEAALIRDYAGVLPPELGQGPGIDSRSDLYMLARTFQGVGGAAETDPELRDLLQRMAAGDPFERLSGIGEALAALGLPAIGPRAPARLLRTPFSGREKLLEKLARTVQASLGLSGKRPARKVRMVQIGGRLGIGKTRLVHELRRSLRGSPVDVVLASCPVFDATGYEPFPEILRLLNDCHALPGDIAATCAQSFAILLPGFGLAAAGTRGRRASLVPPRLQDDISHCVIRCSERRPLVIILDDMHRLEPSAARLLAKILRDLEVAESVEREPKLFILGTWLAGDGEAAAMSEEFADLREEGVIEQVRIPVLSRDGLRNLLCGAAPFAEPRGSEVEEILEISAGNPYHALEILRARTERAQGAGVSFSPEAFPGRPEAVLSSTFKSLDAAPKRALQTLAVLGRPATLDLLGAVSRLSPPRIYGALTGLAAKGFVVAAVRDGDAVFDFAHGSLASIIQASLPAARRRAFHQAAGEAMLGRSDRPDLPRMEELAHHFLNGLDPIKGIRFGVEKADRLSRVHAHEQAVETYQRFLPLIDRRRDHGLWREIVGRIAALEFTTGRFDDAIKHYSVLFSSLPRYTPASARADLCKMTGQAQIKIGDYRRALQSFDRGIRCLTGSKGSPLEARLYGLKAYLHLLLGETRKSDAAVRRCFEAARGQEENEDLAACYSILGAIHRKRLDLAKAYEYHQRSLDIHNRLGHSKSLDIQKRLGHLTNAGQLYNNISTLYCDQYDYTNAIRMVRKSIQLKKKIGDVKGVVSSYVNLAAFLYYKGDHEAALSYGKEALELARAFGYSSDWATTLENLGEMHEGLGRYETGMEYLKRSLRIYERLKIMPKVGSNRVRLASIFVQLGNREAARRNLAEAMEIAERFNVKTLKAEALVVSSDLAQLLGDLGEMKRCAKGALVISQAFGLKAMALRAGVKIAEAQARLSPGAGSRGQILARIRDADAMKLGYELAYAWCLLGEDVVRTGRPAEPGWVRRMLSIVARSGSPDLETRALAVAGDLCRARGEKENALGYYRRAEERIRLVLQDIHDVESKYSFMEHPARGALVAKIRATS